MARSPGPFPTANIKSSLVGSRRPLSRPVGGRPLSIARRPTLLEPRARARPAKGALELEGPWGLTGLAGGGGRETGDRVLLCCLTRRSRDRTVQVDQGAHGEGAARSLTRSVRSTPYTTSVS